MGDTDDDGGAADYAEEDAGLDDLGLGAEGELPESEEDEPAAGDDDEEEGGDAPPEEEAPAAAWGAARPAEAPADPLVQESTSKVVLVFVDGAARETSDWLSLGETSGLISARAAQIAAGSAHFVEGPLPPGCDDAVKIAYRELQQRRCPLVVHRVVFSTTAGGLRHDLVERWYPNEMNHLPIQPPL